MVKKKEAIIKFSDDWFIQLVMPFNKYDEDIYAKWAIWCALSGNKYCIDAKDEYFYTHKLTASDKKAGKYDNSMSIPVYEEWKKKHNL